MTTNTDVVNRALQTMGTRTSVTDAELAGNTSNEAIQANISINLIRDTLLRMAPWDCGLRTANLTYISSVPGTPENVSPATPLWTPGQPSPPWSYEYQYPVDCLRACWIIPANQTGYAGGVPITTAVTGGVAAFWRGPPVKFKIQTDKFIPVTAASVANGGTGYAVGDVITLPIGPNTSTPIGAPAQLQVLTVSGGVILTVGVVNVVNGEASPLGGSYFATQPNPIAQASTTGVGINATFNLTFGPAASQRVILTNQEFATMVYVQQVLDPNLTDPLFQKAWSDLLGAALAMSLTGDKALANRLVQLANGTIDLARTADGNEGLTINDVTPDWIRTRGMNSYDQYTGATNTFDWGASWPLY